jgi:hypothetical protein
MEWKAIAQLTEPRGCGSLCRHEAPRLKRIRFRELKGSAVGPIGVPEMAVLLVVALLWLLPIAAGVWALITLHRLRLGQDELRMRLANIERGLRGRGPD